jgi:hypothetical protein
LPAGINTIAQNNFLNIGRGATLDLNGNSQWVWGLFSDGLLDGAERHDHLHRRRGFAGH